MYRGISIVTVLVLLYYSSCDLAIYADTKFSFLRSFAYPSPSKFSVQCLKDTSALSPKPLHSVLINTRPRCRKKLLLLRIMNVWRTETGSTTSNPKSFCHLSHLHLALATWCNPLCLYNFHVGTAVFVFLSTFLSVPSTF